MKKFLLLFALVTFTMLSFTETSASNIVDDVGAEITIDSALPVDNVIFVDIIVYDKFVLQSRQKIKKVELLIENILEYSYLYREKVVSIVNINFERNKTTYVKYLDRNVYILKPPQNKFNSYTNSKSKLNHLPLRVRGKPFILVKNYNT